MVWYSTKHYDDVVRTYYCNPFVQATCNTQKKTP